MRKVHFNTSDSSDELIPGLEDLYDGDWLDEDPDDIPFPISRMLEAVPQHYADETFVKAGGEKRIYKVRDLRTDRIVALARPVEGADAEHREQFLREARLTACLQHPSIISIYDIGLDVDKEPFFTMEYIRGDTLRDIVGRLNKGDAEYLKRFPITRLVELFIKVCDAVAYAHSRKVVHLDLKPSNIFVGPFGEVLVSDWGLAKIIPTLDSPTVSPGGISEEEMPNGDILNDLTRRGVMKGTPGFMAPEQISGSEHVSIETDVYALGALLYFILTRQQPVSGDTMNALAEQTLQGAITPPSKIIREISYGLEAVVMKALAVDPADRYRSVSKFRDELDRYLLGFATEAQHAGLLVQLKLLIKRRHIAFKVAMVSAVVLVLIVILAFVRVLGEKRVAESAQATAEGNLRLYKEETKLSRALSDSIQDTAMDLINAEDFLHAEGKIRAIESHLYQETDAAKIYALTEYLALLHFVLQDFNQAADYFSQIDVRKRYQDLARLSEAYALIKPDDSKWLEPVDMCDLLFEVKRHVRAVNYYLAYYYLKKYPKQPADKLLPVVETVLDILNYESFAAIETPTLKTVQDSRGWHLSLSGKPYIIFQLPIAVPLYESNVLKPLRLYSLDVSNSGFYDIERLHGLSIQELNISGIEEIPVHKWYMFERLGVERVYHTLEHPDEFIAEKAPGIEFIRVQL